MGEIVLNGEKKVLGEATPLLTLLERLEFRTKWVIVERNGEPVPREEYAATVIEPGDRIEIATPMAGG